MCVFFSSTDAAAGYLFYGSISFLFSSLSLILSFPPIQISFKKKKKYNGAANYDENTGSVGFGFADAYASEYSKNDAGVQSELHDAMEWEFKASKSRL